MIDPVLIIDCGSLYTKYGICSKNESSDPLLLPSSFNISTQQLQSPRNIEARTGSYDKSFEFPIREGKIQNYSKYIKLLQEVINKYVNNPSISNVVLTEQEISMGRDREILTEVLFEQFDFHKVFLARKPVCAMYEGIGSLSDRFGKSTPQNLTGIVLHSGDSYTSATPVYDGYAIVHPYRQEINHSNSHIVPVGGFNLLYPILQDIKYDQPDIEVIDFTKWFEFSSSDYPPFDFSDSSSKVSVKLHERIQINKDRIIEVMFNHNENANQANKKCNVVKMVSGSLENIKDDDFKNELKKNIILSGGNTSHFYFSKRFENELKNEFNEFNDSKIIETKKLASFVIWNGAEKMVKTENFSSRWATKDEYLENGPWISEMKFF